MRAGAGCAIHDAKPEVCRQFFCQWMLNPALPRKFRPDVSKVILMAGGDEANPQLAASCDPSNALAWRREPIYGFLKHPARAAPGGLVVLAFAGRRTWLLLPDEDRYLGEAPEGQVFRVDQHADGRIDVHLVAAG